MDGWVVLNKRATKMVPGLRKMNYDDRLKELKLTRLVERRFRGDMIEAYKILTYKEDIDPEIFFQLRYERGDPELHRGLKIFKKRSKKAPRRNVFSQRVPNPWSILSRKEIKSKKTSGFNVQFDKKEVIRRENLDRPYK